MLAAKCAAQYAQKAPQMNIDSLWNARQQSITPEEERWLIARFQGGDAEALEPLVLAYLPLLLKAVRTHSHLDRDDARQACLEGLMRAVHAFDLQRDCRLAGILPSYLDHALAKAGTEGRAVRIPSRSYARYQGIMRRAGGDLTKAIEIAGEHKMAVNTLLAVHHAVRAESLDASEAAEWLADPLEHVYELEEDQLRLVAAAFAVLDCLEEEIIRASCGFTPDFEPQPDAEIAHRLGMTRPTVQRRRAAALRKVREALAVD